MKTIKKIIKFIYMHPIWTMLIGIFISAFISFTKNGNSFTGTIVFLIIYAFFAPFLRTAREREIRKQEYDYLAKKTAEEIAKVKNETNEKE